MAVVGLINISEHNALAVALSCVQGATRASVPWLLMPERCGAQPQNEAKQEKKEGARDEKMDEMAYEVSRAHLRLRGMPEIHLT